MARRKGLLRRLRELVFRPTPGGKPPPPPSPPAPPAPPGPQPPSRSGLERRAISNVLAQRPLANRKTVTAGVKGMDTTELRWTASASASQLIDAARQDADRMTPDYKPLNPWWYR